MPTFGSPKKVKLLVVRRLGCCCAVADATPRGFVVGFFPVGFSVIFFVFGLDERVGNLKIGKRKGRYLRRREFGVVGVETHIYKYIIVH